MGYTIGIIGNMKPEPPEEEGVYRHCKDCECWKVHPSNKEVGYCDCPDVYVENDYTPIDGGCYWDGLLR